MAEVYHEDLVEQILVRLDVKDLIRFKSVCKSWYSLITSPRFVNRHLNRSYNKDRCNNEVVHRRITLFDDLTSRCDLVGSSNGLVCLISKSSYIPKVFVGNLLTREVRQLKLPHSHGSLSCWGFGYDIIKDDYTVFVGAKKGKNQTCVQVLSLKSNVWRVYGDVKYNFLRSCWFTCKAGILCNGALHWIVKNNDNKKNVIIAYDLSKKKFREIPQPDHARYECTFRSYLGIVKECLCIFRRYNFYSVDHVWLMKSYNVKESWERLSRDHEMKSDNFSHLPDEPWLNMTLGDINSPVYVQSLVSPRVNVRLMRNKRGVESLVFPSAKRPKLEKRSAKILVRVDVKDLLRVKSVCKSWHSLITSPRFINRHLNHSYNKDCCNNNLRSRRIKLGDDFTYGYHLVGSSNGLFCLIHFAYKFLVGNPMSKELRRGDPEGSANFDAV